MTAVNRRRFLQLAGGSAGLALLPQSIAKAAAIPADRRTGTIQDVEHVVVLMQENRSFDHYFGRMRGVRGFGDPRPVTLPSGKPVWNQSNGTRDILPFHPTAPDLGSQFLVGLNHDWAGGQRAYNNGRYDQWIPAKSENTMAYLQREDMPFHYALADAFTVCDAYHCSVIGSTDPNRYYMWTGYTGNDGVGGGPVLDNAEAGYGWTTYPERLEAAGVSWKVYQDAGTGLDSAGGWGWTNDPFIGNYGDNSLLYFDTYRNAGPGDALYEKARTGTSNITGQDYFEILRNDVLNGDLPQVSYVASPEAFSEHSNWPTNFGAWYIAKVIDALTADPKVWARTVLLITYDENDGFFDHVVPPMPPVSRERGLSSADFAGEVFPGNGGKVAGPVGFGPRVPMLAVSPWSKGGFVNSQTFDHTSVIQFMERRFGVHEPNISPWRRAVAGDLTSAFDFAKKPDNAPAELPPTDAYAPADRKRHATYVPKSPVNPAMPVQEDGTRPARPLPYELAVAETLAQATGGLTLAFSSGDRVGANFYVTSRVRTDGPWSYTSAAGRPVSDTLAIGDSYEFTVHGPNGFHREFAGTRTGVAPAVELVEDGTSGNLRLHVTNPSAGSIEITITDAHGIRPPQTSRLKPGQKIVYNGNLRTTGLWYDLTVTTEADPSYLRRLAGHLEVGRVTTSDPAILTA